MSARLSHGCAECAFGKVAGCWRCGSRHASEDMSAWLRRISSGQPIDAVSDIHVNGESRPELTAEAAAAITCWADIDTELDHLAGCYCAVATDLPRPLMAAEACTELGANQPPIGRPPVAFLFAPFFDRWPRFAVLASVISLLLLLTLAGEPPKALEPLAGAYLPGDGFPPELLGAIEQPTFAQAASEAQR